MHAVHGYHAVEQPQPVVDGALLKLGNRVEVVEEDTEQTVGRTAANANDARGRLTAELAESHRPAACVRVGRTAKTAKFWGDSAVNPREE